jgi:hypothetical protein
MTKEILIECPKNYKRIETVMTNFDHTIDRKIEKKLKKQKSFSGYAGYNFYGYVWWDKNKWSCEVWRYNSHVETVSADSLEEIMQQVSNEYGDQ